MSTLLLLVSLLLSPAEARRRTPPPAPPPPPPALVELSAAEKALVEASPRLTAAAVEHLFLLDTSGGQFAVAQASRDAIAAMVAKLPVGDSVTILVYHIRPSTSLPVTFIDEAGRDALVARIKAIDLTSAKDSDLGAGLAYAANQITRSDAAPVIYVYMVGSFCHSPSVGSDYDSGGRGCRAIRGVDKLKDAVAKGRGDRIVAATFFPTAALPEYPIDEGGIVAASAVFPSAHRVDTTKTSFPVWAESFVHRMPLERIAPLLRADATSAALTVKVVTQPTRENPNAVVEVSAGTRFVSAKLTNLRVEGGATADFPAEIDLAPSHTLTIPFSLDRGGISVLPHTETLDLPFSIAGDLVLQPEPGVTSLGIPATRVNQKAEATASYTHSVGWLGLLCLVMGTLSLAVTGFFAFALLRRRAQRLRLGGSFSYRYDGGPRRALDITDLEEAFVGIGDVGELLAGKGRGAVLALRMIRDRNGAYAEVEILVDGVEMNRKPVRRGRHRVTQGGASFQFGGYRLSWE